MPAEPTKTKSLREMRVDSKKTIRQILDEVRSLCPEIAPKERSGIINWEVQGFVDFRIVRALATVYAVEESAIEDAALAAKQSHRRTLQQKKETFLVTSA